MIEVVILAVTSILIVLTTLFFALDYRGSSSDKKKLLDLVDETEKTNLNQDYHEDLVAAYNQVGVKIILIVDLLCKNVLFLFCS